MTKIMQNGESKTVFSSRTSGPSKKEQRNNIKVNSERSISRRSLPSKIQHLQNSSSYPRNSGFSTRWTIELIRDRMHEAMQTLQYLPMPRYGRPDRLRTSLPVLVQDTLIADQPCGTARLRYPPPTAQQVDRLDACLEWLLWITDARKRKVVTGLAQGLPLRKIGFLVGRSHEWVRRTEKTALQQIVNRLNRIE